MSRHRAGRARVRALASALALVGCADSSQATLHVVTQAPGVQLDGFGVEMLYPTRPGGEVWALAGEPAEDARFDPQEPLTRNPDGSWKIRDTQVRLHVHTSAPYDSGAIATHHAQELAQRGYMQSPRDWRDVEMTGYVRLNTLRDSGENLSWYARGGLHNDSRPCEGTSYKGALHYDGTAQWKKESWHVSYTQSPPALATAVPLQGRWVGLKAIMRNITLGEGPESTPAVHLELWLDDDADGRAWMRVHDWVDSGYWGGSASACGGRSDAMPITWGGPLAVFRWDGATDADFKWLSVREIQ